MKNELITIHHPDLEKSAYRTTRRSFEKVWQDRGWVEGTPEETSPEPEVVTTDDFFNSSDREVEEEGN